MSLASFEIRRDNQQIIQEIIKQSEVIQIIVYNNFLYNVFSLFSENVLYSTMNSDEFEVIKIVLGNLHSIRLVNIQK